MKASEVKKGMLIKGRGTSAFIGEIKDTSTRGTVVVKSYYDLKNHYIDLHEIEELKPVFSVDRNGYHCAYIPDVAEFEVAGETREDAYEGLKVVVENIVQRKRERGELYLQKQGFFNVRERE